MSDASIATLAISIDSTGTTAANAGLATLATNSKLAEKAVLDLNAASTASASSGAAVAASYGKFAQSNTELLASLQREVDVLGRSRAEIAARDAAVQNLSAQEQKVATALGASIDKMQGEEAAARALAKAQDASAVSVERLLASLQLKAATVGKSTAASQAEVLASKGASAAQLEQAAAAVATIEGYKKTALESAAAAKAVQGFTLSNNLARREIITMGRELSRGSYTRAASSFTLFAQASNLVTLALSPVGLAVIGVTAALTAGLLVYAKAQAEQKALQNALLLTGNAAGLTEDGFKSLAATIQESIGSATIRGAQETLLGLVASGRLTGDALTSAGRASEAYQKATGASAEVSNKFFLEATANITAFANKTNEQYHYLTAAQQEHIKNLQREGQEQQALTIVFDAFTNRLKPAAENIGTIARAWDTAKQALSGYLDHLLSLGKQDTAGEALTKAQGRLADLQARKKNDTVTDDQGFSIGTGITDADITNAKAEVAALQQSVTTQKFLAEAQAKSNQEQEGQHQLDELHDQYLSKAVRKEQEIKAAQSRADKADPGFNDRVALGTASEHDLAVQKELSATVDGINAKYKERAASTRGTLTPNASLKIDVAEIKAQYKAVSDSYKDMEQIIGAQNAAGLIDQKKYYAIQAALAKANAAEQIFELEAISAADKKFIASGKGTPKDNAEAAKDIAVNNQKIADINTKLGTSLTVLGIRSAEALRKIAVGYQQAAQAAENLFQDQQRSQERTIGAVGKGGEQASYDSARAQITDRYDQQRLALEQDAQNKQLAGTFTDTEKEKYDTALALLGKYEQKSLDSWEQYYVDLKKANNDWYNGYTKALQDYMDQAGFTAKNSEQLFTNSLKGMEDALVTFATTGKLSFKSLIDSFVADIIRLTIQEELIKPIAGMLQGSSNGGYTGGIMDAVGLVTGLFSGGSGIEGAGSSEVGLPTRGGRAAGGPVSSGGLYPVNENGPELLSVAGKQYLMMGGAKGNVTPISGNSGGGGKQYHVTINQSFAPGTDKKTTSQAAASASNLLQRASRVT